MKLRDFVLSLRIRVKLLIAFGSILLMSVLLIGLSITSINKIIYYKNMNEQVDVFKLHLENVELATREFIYEGFKSTSFLETQRDGSVDRFTQNLTQAKSIIKVFQTEDVQQYNGVENLIGGVANSLDSLQNKFGLLQSLLTKRGFKDFGLEGSLRAAIHKVENSEYAYDKAAMLTLRRHEKDFFLRKDLKYQTEFNNKLDEFIGTLQSQNAPASLLENLNNYRNQFNAVVDIEKKIGLKETEGIRGSIRTNFLSMRPQVEKFREAIKEKNAEQIFGTRVTLISVFVIQIIVGLTLAIFYANLLTKSIKEIRTAMQQLADGIFPDKMVVRTHEEIGQTKESFNQFIVRLQTASDFAGRLGAGELQAKYPDQFSNDVLAKSIISMQTKLVKAEEQQTRINWVNEGAAKFNDILKNESEELQTLGDRILKQLVTYIQANQGALFLTRNTDGKTVLMRLSTYAYEKKKYADDIVEIDNGLLGQCVHEKATIYLKEIPHDYVKITSGLGESTPRNIVIVPLRIREDVLGVIELASFSVFEQHQIEFVERMAESIASILYNKQQSFETKRLLEESRSKASVLAQQEEEMRQNSEELQATQEEMQRQSFEMQQEITRLRQKIDVLERERELA